MCGPNVKSRHQPIIEPLETRRLLSGSIAGAFASPIPAAFLPGSTNHVSVGLTNTAKAKAIGSTTITLYASADKSLDSGDVLLTSATEQIKLAPRHRTNERLAFSVPDSLATGKYFLIATVDSSAITGASPTISTAVSAKPVKISSSFSDLAISFAKQPARAIEIDGYSAGFAQAKMKVTNTGNIPLQGNADVRLYLSADDVLNGSDPLLASTPAKFSLRPGQSVPVAVHIAVPPGTAVGGYFLFAVLNPDAAVVDSIAANNFARSAERTAVIDHYPPPNITIVEQTYDTSPDAVVIPDDGGDSSATVPTPASDNTPDTQPSTAPAQDDSAPAATQPSSNDDNSSPSAPPTTEPSPTTDPTTNPSTSGTDDSSSMDSSSSDTGSSDDSSDDDSSCDN
jgi:hypothetical protein